MCLLCMDSLRVMIYHISYDFIDSIECRNINHSKYGLLAPLASATTADLAMELMFSPPSSLSLLLFPHPPPNIFYDSFLRPNDGA